MAGLAVVVSIGSEPELKQRCSDAAMVTLVMGNATNLVSVTQFDGYYTK